MKGKIKKLSFVLVLAVTCLLCVCMFAACGEHEHSYTKWGKDAVWHWKECPDDGAIDESTKKKHTFVAGECECGEIEQQPEYKYGTVSGSVRLDKYGSYDTASLGKVVVDMDNDDVQITGKVEDGRYVYEVTDVIVGEEYNMTISCDGYYDRTAVILLEEEGENVPIGGSQGVTLTYEVFKVVIHDASGHDFSNVNKASDTSLKYRSPGVTLDVISTDSYADVTATINLNSASGGEVQGILLKFEDGSYAIHNFHKGQKDLQFRPELWGMVSVWGQKVAGTDNDNWIEYKGVVNDRDIAKFNGESGLDMTLVRKGGTLYSFIDGRYIDEYELPEARKNDRVNVGFFSFDAKAGGEWSYDISETVPEAMQCEIDVKVNAPEDVEGCLVTVDPEKDVYAFDEEVTLLFTAPDGYRLSALTVGGDDMLDEVVDGSLTVETNKLVLKVEATFVEAVPVDIDIAVKAKKMGTTAAFADGTTVRFKNTSYSFTVANGKITEAGVISGRYTVQADGYFDKVVDIDATTTEIVLEYDLFEIVRWDADGHRLGHVNDSDPYVEFAGPGASVDVISKQNMLGDATVTLLLKGAQTTDNQKQQGLLFRFEDGKAAILNINIESSRPRLQFRTDLFIEKNDPSLGLYSVFDRWVEFENVTAEEIAKYTSDEGVELKVVREGKLLYVFLDDVWHGTATLPDKYADDKMGFGMFAYGAVHGQKWYYTVTETAERTAVTVTDGTAADAKGSVVIEPATGVKKGDVVTVTVTPEEGYRLNKLTVSDATVTRGSGGKYTFVAVASEHNVVATFVELPHEKLSLAVSAKGLGNTDLVIESSEITVTPEGGADFLLTVTEGKIEDFFVPGTYTLSLDGYYDVEATVGADGAFEQSSVVFYKKIFGYNLINEPAKNIFGEGNPELNAGDSRDAAKDGVIKATSNGKIYEWSYDEYGDVALTLTLKSGNGNQGMLMRFNGEQRDVRVRFENTKAQWLGGGYGGWWWGTSCIIDRWDFGNGEDYANPMNAALLAKYNGDGLKLTLARKGGMVYALIDGKIYAAQSVAAYASAKIKLAVFVEDAKAGYSIPFAIESTDTVLARAGVAVGAELVAFGGTWTEQEGTLKVDGARGYAEFKNADNAVKESATMKISNVVGGDQGFMYNFQDGKYIAVRYQNNEGNYKVQYTMDTVFFTDGSLRGWQDFYMTATEKTTFDASGLDLTFIRNGNEFTTYLGDRLIDTAVLDEKYATMNGVMGIMVWGGKNAAFAYSHALGDDVKTASVAYGESGAKGYSAVYGLYNGKATLVLKSDAKTSWGSAPTSIKVGETEYISSVVRASLAAGVATYTLTIDATAEVLFTVEMGAAETVTYNASVNDATMGTVVCDMANHTPANLYYWNDNCTLTVTANEGFELEKIVIGDAEVTEGWEKTDNVYTYSFKVTGNINVVAHFKAASATTDPEV